MPTHSASAVSALPAATFRGSVPKVPALLVLRKDSTCPEEWRFLGPKGRLASHPQNSSLGLYITSQFLKHVI